MAEEKKSIIKGLETKALNTIKGKPKPLKAEGMTLEYTQEVEMKASIVALLKKLKKKFQWMHLPKSN